MILDLIKTPDLINKVVIVFSYIIIIFIAFPIHESSHALAAKFLGDDTADRMGRISLNPLRHLDLVGTIFMLVFGIGWAKPVPVNPLRARKVSMRAVMAITAAAGPVSNILVSLVFMIISKIVAVATGFESVAAVYIYLALNMVVEINLYLGVFNLFMPIPPFDGSRIVSFFLPSKFMDFMERNERQVMIITMVILSTGILSGLFGTIADWIYTGLDFITGFIY